MIYRWIETRYCHFGEIVKIHQAMIDEVSEAEAYPSYLPFLPVADPLGRHSSVLAQGCQ